MNKTALLSIGAAALLASGCSGNRIEDEIDTVESVSDGGTVVLNSGLTVHLLGVSPQSAFAEEYLRANIVGREVALVPDSEGDQTFASYDDEVWAYVTMYDTGEALNRKLLTLAGPKSYYTGELSDSLEAYNAIFAAGPQRRLTDNELSAKLKSASMLVYGSSQEGGFIGTAFFINDNGLAITNNHVLNHGANYRFYLSDSQGNIDFENGYTLNRIVATSDYRTGPDYTIFYVNMDDDSKKRMSWLTISRQPVAGGDKIATVGNPAPGELLPMSYASGTISAVRADEKKLQINAPITHGFSGGALVNEYGEVVGISSSGYDNNNANLNFAVDINVVRDRLDQLNLPYAGK